MKVSVDGTKCQGHTLCAMNAPDVFLLRDEDGHAYTVDGDVPTGSEAAVREAWRTCPEQAIELIE